jgi:putative transposase
MAIDVNADCRRELLELKVGGSEIEPFWQEFHASLKQNGLGVVRLVVSDAHVGLTKAVGRMFLGCSWQRFRVHFARNLLQTMPKAKPEMVAAMLTAKFPRAGELMGRAREDVPAFRHLPVSHWRNLWSTNLIVRVNE